MSLYEGIEAPDWFNVLYAEFIDQYPRVKGTADEKNKYWYSLKHFPENILKKAFRRAIEMSPRFFPDILEIKDIIKSGIYSDEDRDRGNQYNPGGYFNPTSEQKKITIQFLRGLREMINQCEGKEPHERKRIQDEFKRVVKEHIKPAHEAAGR